MSLDLDNLEPTPDVDNIDTSKLDRGDALEIEKPESEVKSVEVEAPKDEEGEEVKDKAKVEPDVKEEEKPRDEKGRFKEKDSIPKARFDEAVNKERSAREAAEQRLAALEKQIAENTKQAEQGKQLGELEDKASELSKQHAQLLVDGDVDKATEVMKQIRSIDRQIARAEMTTETQRTTAATLESERVDLAIAQLEADHAVLNPDSEEFDSSLANFVLSEQRRLMSEQGLSPSKALIKAGTDVVKRFVAPKAEPEPEKKGLKNETDRKTEQVKKNLDADKRQPSSLKDAGIDSDKAGQNKPLPDASMLSQEEFDALPESTKAKMRGDFL